MPVERVECHYVICALCNEAASLNNSGQVSSWMSRHFQFTHHKNSGYVADAPKSITVLYEGEDPVKNQEPEHIDPTTTFITAISFMQSEE